MTHMNRRRRKKKQSSLFVFPSCRSGLTTFCFCARRSEVGEAAGIFLVFIRDEENGFFKFVVMEFLKCDGGGDGGENRDVWRDKLAFF